MFVPLPGGLGRFSSGFLWRSQDGRTSQGCVVDLVAAGSEATLGICRLLSSTDELRTASNAAPQSERVEANRYDLRRALKFFDSEECRGHWLSARCRLSRGVQISQNRTPPLNGVCLLYCGFPNGEPASGPDPTHCPVGKPSYNPVYGSCFLGSVVYDDARSCAITINGVRGPHTYHGICEVRP